MKSRSFLDTNIAVYAHDADAGPKRLIATSLLADGLRSRTGVISTQVLQEYFNTATRKLEVPTADARRTMEQRARLDVVQVKPALIFEAVDCHRLNRISFWDALVVRAAVAAGCAVLCSEDLGHGQVIDGVRIENPLRGLDVTAPA
ncbi:MAG: PIN domain-containing protein [Myxococcales bacterium]|nr:PIN domain-containing protein [Myxococcales bacterium]